MLRSFVIVVTGLAANFGFVWLRHVCVPCGLCCYCRRKWSEEEQAKEDRMNGIDDVAAFPVVLALL